MVIKLLVGTVLGFLTGLGVGGGSLLILWLTMAMEMPQATARGINLLFFLPAALIACLFRWRQGYVDLVKLWPAILGGCTAAAICAWAAPQLDTAFLQKLFGGMLLLTGIRELLWKSRQR